MSHGIGPIKELLETLSSTISSLENKRQFLCDQLPFYEEIYRKIETYEGNEDQANWSLGEIIIQNGKLFKNVGCEYYVEESKEECAKFVKMRIELMEEAIGQFDDKLKEANNTLTNMKKIHEQELGLSGETEWEDEDDTALEFMEIREDLDEYDNVVTSSVTPTKNSESKKMVSLLNEIEGGRVKTIDGVDRTVPAERIGDIDDETLMSEKVENDFKQIPIVGDIMDRGNNAMADEVGEVNPLEDSMIENTLDEDKKAPVKTTKNEYVIARDDMYTFDDLVQQLDEIDQEEDGYIDASEISYDFEAYDEFDDEEDREDSDEEYGYAGSIRSIVPAAAQQSFMEQINALRKQQPSSLGTASENKSILKSSTSKKNKKSVNFASQLDVYEVENVKRETKKNTFNSSYSSNLSGNVVELDDEGFDADLFAKMLGVKDAEDLHEKYSEGSNTIMNHNVEEKPKKRISRFKKEKTNAEGRSNYETAYEVPTSDVVIENPVSEVVVENDLSALKPDGYSSIVSDVFEKQAEVPNLTISKDERSSIFKGEFRSLQKPGKKQNNNTMINFSDLEDDTDSDDNNTNTLQKHEETDEPPSTFFPKIEGKPVQKPSLDYHNLTDLDDMAKAYVLGLYDDDLDDPGTVLERIEDFQAYNERVTQLAPEIKTFIDETTKYENTDEDGPVMQDILERDFTDIDQDELDEQMLQSQVSDTFHKLRIKMLMNRNGNSEYVTQNQVVESELEPIDEYGNPIKVSKFKSVMSSSRDTMPF